MKIAVILCTYNRCESLARALESLAASRMPDTDHWRVLVVDNNSSDNTRAVIAGFRARFPGRFEYVFEAQQGKSYALNRGVEMADAEALAFTDDDVQVDRDWLCRITAPLSSEHWSGVAGRILPEQGFTPQIWMDVRGRYGLAPLAMFDPAIPAGKIDEPPFGANMAYRKGMFSKHGEFRLDLGPQPGGEIKNEDVEFGSRILAAGERICYEPDAIVYHEVPRHRMKPSHFLGWWYCKGRSDNRVEDNSNRLCILGVPIFLLRRLAVWTLRWMFSINPAQRFSCKAKVWYIAGNLSESVTRSRKAESGRISESHSTL